jgi:hypothetical protein
MIVSISFPEAKKLDEHALVYKCVFKVIPVQ